MRAIRVNLTIDLSDGGEGGEAIDLRAVATPIATGTAGRGESDRAHCSFSRARIVFADRANARSAVVRSRRAAEFDRARGRCVGVGRLSLDQKASPRPPLRRRGAV
jgi:hypothetical protein